MADEKHPLDAVRALMLENLDKMQAASQGYIDMVEKAMQSVPGAQQDAIANFKAYLEGQVAANREYVEKPCAQRTFRKLSASRLNTSSLN